MTHLNIQQGSNVEIVSAQIIKKLYDTALTVSEPLEGETDAAYMSGNLLVNKASRKACTYLTTRFPNLHINVTGDYYIDFEDDILGNRLISLCSSDGVGVTEADAANAIFSQDDLADISNDVTSFNEFGYFTKANSNFGNLNSRFRYFVNLTSIDLTNLQYLRGSDFRQSGITTVNAPSLVGVGWFEGVGAFQDCTNLTTVQSFGSLTLVPGSCFQGCTNLTTFPFDNITEIKEHAFRNSGISGELYCKNLTTISGGSAFRNVKSITKVLCLGKTNYINSYTFFRDNTTGTDNLTEVYLPYECTSIGTSTFYNCKGLTTLKQYEHSVDNWVNGEPSTSTSIISRVTSFGLTCFLGCTNLTATIDLTNVTDIGLDAFKNTKILVTGTPSLYINIGSGAFVNCSNLTSFDFSNITTINRDTFNLSGLSGILSIPNLTGVLNGGEFYKCRGLTSITNLGSITSICDDPSTVGGFRIGSFSGCTGLTSVTIPSTVTKIGWDAFSECTSLSQVNCSWLNIIEIGPNAFNNHADWDFIVNLQNPTTIGKNALGGNRSSKKIRQLYIPKIINTVSDSYYINLMYYSGTFTGITADIIYLRDLQSLHPGDFAWTTCTALVINNITPPVWKNRNDLTDEETTDPKYTKDKVFSDSTITNIYVPDSAVTTYQTDANWSSVANKIQPLSSLTKVATEADLLANQVALIEAYM